MLGSAEPCAHILELASTKPGAPEPPQVTALLSWPDRTTNAELKFRPHLTMAFHQMPPLWKDHLPHRPAHCGVDPERDHLTVVWTQMRDHLTVV